MTNHREIQRIIYNLKRQWGTPMTLKRETTSLDVDTGVETPTVTATVIINRGILLPRKMSTDFSYDLSYIASNKNFTYGGFFGKTSRLILVDARDLGKYVIAKQDFIIINNKRYVINDFDEYDHGAAVIAYMITVTNVEADPDVV